MQTPNTILPVGTITGHVRTGTHNHSMNTCYCASKSIFALERMYRQTAATHLRELPFVHLPEPVVELICVYFDVRSALIESLTMRQFSAIKNRTTLLGDLEMRRRSASESATPSTLHEASWPAASRATMSTELAAFSHRKLWVYLLRHQASGFDNALAAEGDDQRLFQSLIAACLHDLQNSTDFAYFLLMRVARQPQHISVDFRWAEQSDEPVMKCNTLVAAVHRARCQVDRDVPQHTTAADLYILCRFASPHTLPLETTPCRLRRSETDVIGLQTALRLVWLGSTRVHLAALVQVLDKQLSQTIHPRCRYLPVVQRPEPRSFERLPGSCKIALCSACGNAGGQRTQQGVPTTSCAECQDFGLEIQYSRYLPRFVSRANGRLELLDDASSALLACFVG